MSQSATGLGVAATASHIGEYDAVVGVMNRYIEGVRTGNSSDMKPAFHEACTFYGYHQGNLLAGPIHILFDWVDWNGPSTNIQARVSSVDIRESIASVRIELENMTGKLSGPSPVRL